MTTLRWPDGRGRFRDTNTDRTPGDVNVLEVGPGVTIDIDDDDVVEHYLGRGFERVDDGSDTDSDGADDGFDVESFVDRTPVFEVVDDIEAGEADGHLDAVKAADDRVTVEEAVDSRKAEIAGD